MRMRHLAVMGAFLAAMLIVSPAQAQNEPPKGFTALIEGKDISGWHGMNHFDPRKLWAMSEEERAKKRAGDTKSMRQN